MVKYFLSVGGGVLLALGLLAGFLSGAGKPRLPQPIAFDHKLHVKEYQISCVYCHSGVGQAPVARIPSVQTCVDCHQAQKEWEEIAPQNPEVPRDRKNRASFEEQELGKLKWFWTKKQSIPWQKVYDLPDHVQFDHKRHIRVGVSCAECHGDVADMTTVKQVKNLNMAFCLSCHRKAFIAEPPVKDKESAGTNEEIYAPLSPKKRLKNQAPVTWTRKNPHKKELKAIAQELGFKVRQVRFDCATCHM